MKGPGNRSGSPLRVSRHPRRRWGGAPQAVLWGEPQAPDRCRAQEVSLPEAVRDGVVPWSSHLQRGASSGEVVPGPTLPQRPANTCCRPAAARQDPSPLSCRKGATGEAGAPVSPGSGGGAAARGREGRQPRPTGRRRRPAPCTGEASAGRGRRAGHRHCPQVSSTVIGSLGGALVLSAQDSCPQGAGRQGVAAQWAS